MKKIIGYLVLAFVMLVPFRMVYMEVGQYSNPVHVLLFLSVLVGLFIGFSLMKDDSVKEEKVNEKH